MASITVGNVEIVQLLDLNLAFPFANVFPGVNDEQWAPYLAQYPGSGESTDLWRSNAQCYALRSGGEVLLIDTGFGPGPFDFLGGATGNLVPDMQAQGVEPDSVGQVAFTHLHGDHVGWNIHDNEGDRLMFPNATFYVDENELSYWTGSASDDNPMAENVRRRINPVVAAGRVETTEGEFAVSEALTMVPAPGHTPGHCTVLAASQGTHLLLLGDAAHHPVHLEHHDWIPQVDLDPAESTRSRGKVARLAIEKDAIVTSGHFPILSLGRIREVGGGYKWELIGELG